MRTPSFRRISDNPESPRKFSPWTLKVDIHVIQQALYHKGLDYTDISGYKQEYSRRAAELNLHNNDRIPFFDTLTIWEKCDLHPHEFCIYPHEFDSRYELLHICITLHHSDIPPQTWIHIVGHSIPYLTSPRKPNSNIVSSWKYWRYLATQR